MFPELFGRSGLNPKKAANVIYERGFELWLALWLAVGHHRLCYRSVWQKRNVTEYILRVWHACEKLAPQPRQVARRKLEKRRKFTRTLT